MRARIVAFGLAGALVACLDLDETKGPSSDAGKDALGLDDAGFPDGAGTGGSSCGPAMHCAAPPPDTSWAGPFFRWQGAPTGTPPCSSGTPAFSGATKFDSGTHTCSCSCDDTLGCPTSFQIDLFDTTACSAPCATTDVGGECLSSFSGCGTLQHFAVHPYSVDGACTATVQKQIAGAAPTDALIACPTSPAGGCSGNGLCVTDPPPPFDAKLCIGKSGDAECSGAYSQKISGYSSFEDTRDCALGTCDCSQTGSCVLLLSPCAALTGLPISPGGSTCSFVGNGAFRLGTPANSVACKQSGTATATGKVTPTGSFTLCCEA